MGKSDKTCLQCRDFLAMKNLLLNLLMASTAIAKFCPLEKNEDKCRAKDNSYKCAVFFEYLKPSRQLTWIGALPDALNKPKSTPLDSCDRNLFKTSETNTIGDYLCKQVKRWLAKDDNFRANGIRDLKMPFYYSDCNGDWTPVSSNGENLYASEPLCCNSDGTFFRCNGEPFNEFCKF